ncbi:MAG: hypothetical protein D4R43_02170 [Sphingobacteriales bacterium]|nr:MAG: hypothetical protein D4R43_02170 [Sphingobacteriales bacterium]
MKTVRLIVIVFFITSFLFKQSKGQAGESVNFFDRISQYDLSKILITDSITIEDDETNKENMMRMEPIGFIGENYQRFYIHFISMSKNNDEPNEYYVTGKTKVKSTICDFHGTIKITSSRIYLESDHPGYKEGYAKCEVNLFEDKQQESTGFISGNLKSEFIIDDKEQFRYDGLMFFADRFSNNQFEGVWTSYKTNFSKKCNWGDYRIPDSGDLDIGAGEFSVADKYLQNGWSNYKIAWSGNPNNPDEMKARQIEFQKWWE